MLSSCGKSPTYRHYESQRIVTLDYYGNCEYARERGQERYDGFVNVYKDLDFKDPNRLIDTSGESANCAVVYGFEYEGDLRPMVVRIMPLTVFQFEYRLLSEPAAAAPAP